MAFYQPFARYITAVVRHVNVALIDKVVSAAGADFATTCSHSNNWADFHALPCLDHQLTVGEVVLVAQKRLMTNVGPTFPSPRVADSRFEPCDRLSRDVLQN